MLLSPLGAYRLLGLPMAELSGQLVDLVEVLGPPGRRLGEQLRETPSWQRRFALLDRFLLGRLEGGPQPSPEVGWAWERLVASGGAVPIGRLASEVGWSHKRLDWGRVAREAGYADQAHLIRDFHQFTGTTPTAFVARTTPPGGGGDRQVNFVQDTVAAAS